MADVVRGDETRAGSLGKTEQRLVVGIGKPRILWRGEFHAVGGLADGVQKKVHFIERGEIGVRSQILTARGSGNRGNKGQIA